MSQSSDDEFSSGSSVDPSTLVMDWRPSTATNLEPASKGQKEDKEVNVTQRENEKETIDEHANKQDRSEIIAEGHCSTHTEGKGSSAGAKNDSNHLEEEPATARENNEIRLIFGKSILDWQKELKGEARKQKSTECITLRHGHYEPLPSGSKLVVKSSNASLVVATEHGVQEYNGQRTSSTGAWLDCIAVYDETREAYVLSKVDWSAHLKLEKTKTGDTAQHPRKRHSATTNPHSSRSSKRHCA